MIHTLWRQLREGHVLAAQRWDYTSSQASSGRCRCRFLMSGCSSDDPAQAKEWQRDYCTKLGSWQDAAHAMTTGEADADAGDGQGVQSPKLDNTESAGDAVIEASKRLDRAGLEHGGTDILDDTVNAVGGDIGAEGRAVTYCDSSGFETLVSAAG